jgi:tagatose-1,6-bisphosphate aldolase
VNLPSIHQQNRFSLLALHQVADLAEQAGLELNETSNHKPLEKIIGNLIKSISPHVTGIALEPDHGLPQLKTKTSAAGLILPLQLAEEVDPLSVPTLSNDWGVEQIANNYGVAMLELFYHPTEPNALLKKQLLAELMDYCQYTKIDLIVRLRVFSPHGEQLEPNAFQAAQIQALQELQTMSHLFILDAPPDVLAAATITAELDIPWVVWLSEPKYEDQKNTLRMCVESGARGYMIGNALWPELHNLRRKDAGFDEVGFEELCKTTLRDRVLELSRIVSEEVV